MIATAGDPQTDEKKVNKKGIVQLLKWLLIVSVSLLVVGLIAASAVAFMRHQKLEKAVSTSQSFITNVKAKNYDAAYNLFSSDYKKTLSQSDLQSVVSLRAFKSAIEGTGKVTAQELSNKDSTAAVTIQFKSSSNQIIPIQFVLHSENNQWQITAISSK